MEGKEDQFWTIIELSQYLKVKTKTIYKWVEECTIPHYKIGRLVRFKQCEIDIWLEGYRKEQVNDRIDRCVKRAMKSVRNANTRNPDRLAKKIIDEVKKETYTSKHGKSDQTRDLGKEVNDGNL